MSANIIFLLKNIQKDARKFHILERGKKKLAKTTSSKNIKITEAFNGQI